MMDERGGAAPSHGETGGLPFAAGKWEPKKLLLKDFFVCFSLANILFIRCWLNSLGRNVNGYFAEIPYSRYNFVGVVLLVLVSGSMFFGFSRLFRTTRNQWLKLSGRLGFASCWMLAGLLAVDLLRRALNLTDRFTLDRVPSPTHPLVVTGALVALFLVWRFLRLMNRLSYRLLLAGAFFMLVTFGRAASGFYAGDWPVAAEQPKRAVRSTNVTRPRLLWFIFDELDYRVVFQDRPAGLVLTNLDWFAAHSLFATQAYSPARMTMQSIPSLLSGNSAVSTERLDTSNLRMIYRDKGEDSIFPGTNNVIQKLHDEGRKMAVIGWFHPYSRWFKPATNLFVAWRSTPNLQPFTRYTLYETMRAQLQYNFIFSYPRKIFAHNYQYLHQEAMREIQGGDIDFAFFHYPIPHPPWIFNGRTDQVKAGYVFNGGSYFENVQLVDRVLGEVRRSVTDNQTSIIISADHWWRSSEGYDGKSDRRIPFIVHMAGEDKRLTFTNAMNSVVTQGLVQEILNGHIGSNAQVQDWLVTHPAPVYLEDPKGSYSRVGE